MKVQLKIVHTRLTEQVTGFQRARDTERKRERKDKDLLIL